MSLNRYTPLQVGNARRLRREMTKAEKNLWNCLRNRGIGAKFRRQVPIGNYVADFACVAAKLIVELDGPTHDDPEQQAHDIERDAWLRRQGWTVLRFPNDFVFGGGPIIVEKIQSAFAASAPSSDPR